MSQEGDTLSSKEPLATLKAFVEDSPGRTSLPTWGVVNIEDRSWHLLQSRADGSVVADGIAAKLTKHECEVAAAKVNPEPLPQGGLLPPGYVMARSYSPTDIKQAECFQ